MVERARHEVAGAAEARSRSKGVLLGATAVAGAVALFASTQVWVTLVFAPGVASVEVLALTGQELNAAFSPLSIAAIAAALALTIAGPVLRRILGVVVALLGFGTAALTVDLASNWARAASGRLAEFTGISGGAQADMVAATEVSFFVWVTVAAGGLLALLGVVIAVVSGRWRTGGRKYQKNQRAGASGAASDDYSHDRISEWDELSGGYDPTSDEPSRESP